MFLSSADQSSFVSFFMFSPSLTISNLQLELLVTRWWTSQWQLLYLVRLVALWTFGHVGHDPAADREFLQP